MSNKRLVERVISRNIAGTQRPVENSYFIVIGVSETLRYRWIPAYVVKASRDIAQNTKTPVLSPNEAPSKNMVPVVPFNLNAKWYHWLV
jgi:hypothetical protein